MDVMFGMKRAVLIMRISFVRGIGVRMVRPMQLLLQRARRCSIGVALEMGIP